jgi:transporter family-2 protein
MWTVRPVPRKEIGLEALAIPALFVGTLLALQAAANVQLAAAMTSPVGASTLQLAIGAALLVALAAVGGSLGALAGLERAQP